MKPFIALLFVLGLALPAHAEPLKISASLFTVGAAADAASTCRVFAGGGHESNPLMARNCAGVVGVKTAVGAMVLTAALKLSEHKPKLARTLLYLGAGVSAGAAVHNLKVVR